MGKPGALNDLGQQRTRSDCQKDRNWAVSRDQLLSSEKCVQICLENLFEKNTALKDRVTQKCDWYKSPPSSTTQSHITGVADASVTLYGTAEVCLP